MKNLFGLAICLLLSFAAQAQYKTFPKGKMNGDIIGKGDIRFEVVRESPTTVHLYPINTEGNALENAPKKLHVEVLFLDSHSSEISDPVLKEGRYTVYQNPDRIINTFFINGDFGKEKLEMKEQMIEAGR